MKSYFQKILFICLVNLTFTTMTFSQDIGSEWINVRGMGNQQYDHTGNANHGTIYGATWSIDVP